MSRAAKLYQEFMDNSRQVTRNAYHVKINEKKLDEFAAALKCPDGGAPSWSEYLSSKTAKSEKMNLTAVFREMAVITAQNGGYLYRNEKSQTAKWEIDNSGAKALLALFDDLRADDVFKSGPKAYGPAEEAKIKSRVQDLPMAQTRMDIFNETCQFGWFMHIRDILKQADKDGRLVFDMETVELIAKKYPKAYGDDPLRKKAILLCLMVAGHARSRGVDVELSDLPVPSDYRIPETLNAAGVLEFSDDLIRRLDHSELILEDDPIVAEIRNAAIVAVEKICQKSGLKIDQVDLALWMASRDGTLEALKKANTDVKVAKNHLACKTMWF